jgi:peptide-methionine (S)-S-oxide reductase
MTETAVFGGGCFWCTEAVFKMMKGVVSVVPGYAGGTVPHPTYEQVTTGTTGHAECVKVEYNPEETRYIDLLRVFFGSHDPTTINRQGNDVGSQYRSIIFYTTVKQKAEAEIMISDINLSSDKGPKVVTELEPLTDFYEAENYHKDYFERNPGNPYCSIIINPKLEKVQKEYAALLKDIYRTTQEG